MLAIDVGNSNWVLGLYSGNELQKVLRLNSGALVNEDQIRKVFSELLGEPILRDLDDQSLPITLSSVVQGTTRLLRKTFPHAQVIDSTWPFSFQIATDQPEQTGVDRLVNAHAAIELIQAEIRSSRSRPKPIILVDAGTATTFCAVTSTGVFLGGAIAPGLGISAEALFSMAPALPRVSFELPDATIGMSTSAALQSGILQGYACLVDGMIGRFRTELKNRGEPGMADVFITGGFSRLLAKTCEQPMRVEPDLTLKGIHSLFVRQETQA